MSEIIFKNVRSLVRPHRAVVLIDVVDQNWRFYVESIISACSKVWGGESFLIIPTDGRHIKEVFWEIMKAYSPDVIAQYTPSVMDLEKANPKRYALLKKNYLRQWRNHLVDEDKDPEESWTKAASDTQLNTNFELSDDLRQRLMNELNPFHHKGDPVIENVLGSNFPGYPFTDVIEINKNARTPFRRVTIPLEIKNQDLNILFLSRVGKADGEYANKATDCNVKVINLPDNGNALKYLPYIDREDVGSAIAKTYLMVQEGEGLPDDFEASFPFMNSMLHLDRYYLNQIHREHQENIKVIIGDSVEDYCLFYCLSRLHKEVYWLPDSLLKKTHKKFRVYDKDSLVKFSPEEECISSLVNSYMRKIKYGHSQKGIDLTSVTLSSRQLAARRNIMSELTYFDADRLMSRSVIVPADKRLLKCVSKVIEKDNFFNQQDLIFQNGESIARVETPKPKNFIQIDQQHHRWITQLNIEDYLLPPLPFLSEEVFRNIYSGYDCRVATDGLAYFCPNHILFGGDVDTNLVKPKLRILYGEEFFKTYFNSLGYTTELSDKGSYLKDTIQKFGTLEDTASFFKRKENRLIFDQYVLRGKTDQVRTADNVYLDVTSRNYLTFQSFKKYLKSRELTIKTIDYLLKMNVIQRGLIFQCENCRRTDWYQINEVGREFTCKRCELTQDYSHNKWKWSDEPQWYYRLAETVYQFYRSSSYLTALALDKIQKDSTSSFTYVSESNIIDKDGTKREIDIIALSDGKVLLGECKDTAPTVKDLGKYNHMIKQFKYKPAQFVLATTQSRVSPTVKAFIAGMGEYRIITKKDIFGE